MRDGLMAEFERPEALLAAAREMRKSGYRRLDAYTPYPLREVEEALELPPSRLPLLVFGAGMLGAGGGYFLQWLVNAYLYPLIVGSRPPHMPLAFVPITFEMGVLMAALAAFFGMLAFARLVRLWDPVFEISDFERASVDRFWLQVSARDQRFRYDDTRRDLEALGALRVVPFGRRAE